MVAEQHYELEEDHGRTAEPHRHQALLFTEPDFPARCRVEVGWGILAEYLAARLHYSLHLSPSALLCRDVDGRGGEGADM